MNNGVIVKGIGGFYYVKTADGMVIECRARGVFRKNGITPLVGDRASVSDDGGGGLFLAEIFPRKNSLVRPAVANVDCVVIVAAVTSPAPDTVLLDKMTVAAELRGIEPIICINKSDLADTARLKKIYGKTGYSVVVTSADDGSGTEELKDLLKGKISAFTGNSGVGKSSLLNRLAPHFVFETGEVSKIERGRHTTRHAELMELSNGALVIDTPGFGSFEVDSMEAEELKNYFPEFRAFDGMCRFSGCNHIAEPDCAVMNAVKQKIVSKSRHNSYKKLFEELKSVKKW